MTQLEQTGQLSQALVNVINKEGFDNAADLLDSTLKKYMEQFPGLFKNMDQAGEGFKNAFMRLWESSGLFFETEKEQQEFIEGSLDTFKRNRSFKEYDRNIPGQSDAYEVGFAMQTFLTALAISTKTEEMVSYGLKEYQKKPQLLPLDQNSLSLALNSAILQIKDMRNNQVARKGTTLEEDKLLPALVEVTPALLQDLSLTSDGTLSKGVARTIPVLKDVLKDLHLDTGFLDDIRPALPILTDLIKQNSILAAQVITLKENAVGREDQLAEQEQAIKEAREELKTLREFLLNMASELSDIENKSPNTIGKKSIKVPRGKIGGIGKEIYEKLKVWETLNEPPTSWHAKR